ncbi:hypothetical protein EK904_007435, partial [Melospiza melodia maxima]
IITSKINSSQYLNHEGFLSLSYPEEDLSKQQLVLNTEQNEYGSGPAGSLRVTIIDTHERQQMDSYKVLEINDAACHGDVGVILQDARGRRTHHPSYAAGPVLPPPGATIEPVLPHGTGDNLNEIYIIFDDFHHQIQMRCLQPSTLLSFLPSASHPDYQLLSLDNGPTLLKHFSLTTWRFLIRKKHNISLAAEKHRHAALETPKIGWFRQNTEAKDFQRRQGSLKNVLVGNQGRDHLKPRKRMLKITDEPVLLVHNIHMPKTFENKNSYLMDKQDIRMEDTLKQTKVANQGRCKAHENGPNTARTTLKLNNVQKYLLKVSFSLIKLDGSPANFDHPLTKLRNGTDLLTDPVNSCQKWERGSGEVFSQGTVGTRGCDSHLILLALSVRLVGTPKKLHINMRERAMVRQERSSRSLLHHPAALTFGWNRQDLGS